MASLPGEIAVSVGILAAAANAEGLGTPPAEDRVALGLSRICFSVAPSTLSPSLSAQMFACAFAPAWEFTHLMGVFRRMASKRVNLMMPASWLAASFSW